MPPDAPRQVLFEFIPIGNAVKVIAIDPETGLEVSIQGPVTASVAELERVAAAKLRRQLRRQGRAGGQD